MSDKREVKLRVEQDVCATAVLSSGILLCLGANKFVQVPVRSGQRCSVEAWINASCDDRGWTFDNWAHRCGPEGVPGFILEGSLGWPLAPIGMLIGSFSEINAGQTLERWEAHNIFGLLAFPVGGLYVGASPIDGFLYLIMNDTWSYTDNLGSVQVRIIVG